MDNRKLLPREGRNLAQVLDACTDGLLDGLRSHIPVAIGIVLRSVSICISLLIAHYLVGVPLPASSIGAGIRTLIQAV